MKKIVKLTESDLTRIVKRVINEQSETDQSSKFDKMSDASLLKYLKYFNNIMGDISRDLQDFSSDLIYNKNKSHFYNGGTNDPLRLGVDLLKTYLDNLKNSFVFSHNLIFNLSEETDTLLPFDKISTDDFYKLKI